MLSVDKVSQLSHRIFNTSKTEQNIARESNPFAKSNFQKNILTEDVFESSSKQNVTFTGLNDKIAQGTKRIYSTFVGSINNFGKRFYDGIESLKEFCHSFKNGVSGVWNKIQEIGSTEVHIIDSLKQGYEWTRNILTYDMGQLVNSRRKQVAQMAKMDPHTEVKPMLIDSIEALAAEIAQAA